jgi:S-DNA-T family DNA segregation ATPase FtsK/SpoIIIE
MNLEVLQWLPQWWQILGFGSLGSAICLLPKAFKKEDDRSETEKKLNKVFEHTKLYNKINKDIKEYPRLRNHQKTDYGYQAEYTIPYGKKPKNFIKRKEEIETALESEVQFNSEGRKLTMKIITEKFENKYPYSRKILKKLKKMKLGIPIGYTKEELITFDIAEKQLHFLIAGYSGSGKSVTIRSMITSLIMNYSPDYVKFYLNDLKKVELAIFKDSPYVNENGYATDHDQVLDNLIEVEEQMEYRYEIMEEERVTNVNQLPDNSFPYIVVVFDEYAELSPNMLVGDEKKTGKAIQSKLGKLFRMGRAAGIFFIVCTQRPDAQVIDGQIKANTQVKICHRVTDGVNSRIVLGNNLAADLEDIPGRGIFKLNKNIKFQAPYLSPGRAKKLLQERYKQFKSEEEKESNVVDLEEARKKSESKVKAKNKRKGVKL